MNDLILGVNFSLLLLLLEAELLNVLLLLVKLCSLVADLALESLELFLDVRKFVLRQLNLTLGSGCHLHDLLFIIRELLSNQGRLSIRVLDDLVHHLLVVSLHGAYILLQ